MPVNAAAEISTCDVSRSPVRGDVYQVQYDLFILDHEMKDRAAFDLTRLVRSLNHREHLPVMVAGSEGESLMEFTRASGGDAHGAKAKGFSTGSSNGWALTSRGGLRFAKQ